MLAGLGEIVGYLIHDKGSYNYLFFEADRINETSPLRSRWGVGGAAEVGDSMGFDRIKCYEIGHQYLFVCT